MSSTTGKKATWGKRLVLPLIFLGLFLLIVFGVRSCSGDPSAEAGTGRQNKAAAFSTAAAARAADISLAAPRLQNMRCAPFAYAHQTCELKADGIGSGLIGLADDLPPGLALCFLPGFGTAGDGLAGQPFKKIVSLLADGRLSDVTADSQSSTSAMQFIPNYPLTLTYYAVNGTCKNPLPPA